MVGGEVGELFGPAGGGDDVVAGVERGLGDRAPEAARATCDEEDGGHEVRAFGCEWPIELGWRGVGVELLQDPEDVLGEPGFGDAAVADAVDADAEPFGVFAGGGVARERADVGAAVGEADDDLVVAGDDLVDLEMDPVPAPAAFAAANAL